MIIGHKFLMLQASLMLFVIFTVNAACIYALLNFRTHLKPKMKIAFDKTIGMSIRLIGFFAVAIGVDMIITGINNLYFG